MLIKNTEFTLNSIPNIYETSNAVKTARKETSFTATLSKAGAKQANNVDKIEISKSADGNHAGIKEIKNRISHDLNSDTDPLKLEGIKDRVQCGNYNFDPAELAGLLLSDF